MFDISKSQESLEKFYLFVNDFIFDLLSKINEIDNNLGYKKIYEELEKSKDASKFLEYYDILSKIDESIKDELDVLKFLQENDLLNVEQTFISMNAILTNKNFIKLMNNMEDNLKKEKLKEDIEKCKSIVNGQRVDFNYFLELLRKSSLTEKEQIEVLALEAYKSTQLVVKKDKEETPIEIEEEKEIDINSEENLRLMNKYKNIKGQVTAFINKYYSLIESKTAKQIEFYKRVNRESDKKNIYASFTVTEELLCLFIVKLISLKEDAESVLSNKPIDYEIFEVCCEELFDDLSEAIEISKKYEDERTQSIPVEANVYFLLLDGKPIFELDGLSEEDKEKMYDLVQDLESGLYDYEVKRGKNNHTMVKQDERRDLNVFVNRKRDTSVSFIRITNPETLESKVLVLNFDNSKNIFASVQSILRNSTLSPLIDEIIEKIKSEDLEFMYGQKEFRFTFDSIVSQRKV